MYKRCFIAIYGFKLWTLFVSPSTLVRIIKAVIPLLGHTHTHFRIGGPFKDAHNEVGPCFSRSPTTAALTCNTSYPLKLIPLMTQPGSAKHTHTHIHTREEQEPGIRVLGTGAGPGHHQRLMFCKLSKQIKCTWHPACSHTLSLHAV